VAGRGSTFGGGKALSSNSGDASAATPVDAVERLRAPGTAVDAQNGAHLPSYATQDVGLTGGAVAKNRPHQEQPVAGYVPAWSSDGTHIRSSLK
jgi:hypothetical protein